MILSLFQRARRSVEIKSCSAGFHNRSLYPVPFSDEPGIAWLHQQLCKLHKSLVKPCCSHPSEPAPTLKRRSLDVINKYFYNSIISGSHHLPLAVNQLKYSRAILMFAMNIFQYLFVQFNKKNCNPKNLKSRQLREQF